jgi:(R,R)-butanediol dehydrogenase/meso-butanediol dehydrogenase/diacetyl reductase
MDGGSGQGGQALRAGVYHGVEDVRVEDVEEPVAGAGEVKVRVAFNGLCGTDVHEVYDGARAIPVGQPHPLTGVMAPVILGHEAAGHVVDVGTGVSGLEDGALVVIEPIRRCGVCPPCRAGAYNMCDVVAFHGLATTGGGLAELTTVPREMVHVVPPGVSPELATLVEPLTVSYHAVARSGVVAGQRVAVHGGGPIGIGVLLTLLAQGIAPVLVVEPAPERQAIVTSLGGSVVDPADGPVKDQVLDRTGGQGVHVSFDTAGAATSFAAACASTAKQGMVMVVAAPHVPAEAVLRLMLVRELSVRTSFAYCGEFPAVIDAVAAGAYPTEGWVSVVGLSDVVDAFARLRAGHAMKILVDPTR